MPRFFGISWTHSSSKISTLTAVARLTQFEGRGHEKFPKGPPFTYIFLKNFQRVPPLLTFFWKISKGSPLCLRFSKKFEKKIYQGGGGKEYWLFSPFDLNAPLFSWDKCSEFHGKKCGGQLVDVDDVVDDAAHGDDSTAGGVARGGRDSRSRHRQGMSRCHSLFRLDREKWPNYEKKINCRKCYGWLLDWRYNRLDSVRFDFWLNICFLFFDLLPFKNIDQRLVIFSDWWFLVNLFCCTMIKIIIH